MKPKLYSTLLLVMAIVMMAMNPAKVLADDSNGTSESSSVCATGEHSWSDGTKTYCTKCNHGFIYYTASAKLDETNDDYTAGLHPNAFGTATLLSHEFADGKGTITFNSQLTSIGERAFFESTGLKSVIVPSSVTSIGDYAFWNCTGLQTITIPSGVTSIGIYAFNYCSDLQSIAIPNGVTSIGGAAFAYTGISSVIIPSSVTSIDDLAFNSCPNLQTVIIPSSVTSIGDYAFWSCTGLQTITIPSSVTSIGSGAFTYCGNLTAVYCEGTSPATLESDVFNNSVVLGICVPEESIEAYKEKWKAYANLIMCPQAIRYRASLREGEVIEIDTDLFGDDLSITEHTFGKSIGTIIFDGPVTRIGEEAFYNKERLQSIIIPNGVTSIGDCAFVFCSNLQSITIPGSVTSIGSGAFVECPNLGSVQLNSIPQIAEYAFDRKEDPYEEDPYEEEDPSEGANYKSAFTLSLNDDSYVADCIDEYFPTLTNKPTYTRQMSNTWGTIVVPFSITYDANNQNYKLYYLTKATDTALTFAEYEDGATIPAGTPMAIKAVNSEQLTVNNGKYTVVLVANDNTVNIEIPAETPQAEGLTDLTMNGTYTAKTIGGTEGNGVYFIANNKFWRADAETKVNPFRAWFEGTIGSNAKSLSIIVEDDETTAIGSVNSEQLTVNNGKYLENGNIVIVKNGKKFNLNGQKIR